MADIPQKHQQIQADTLNRYLLLFKRTTIETDIESFTGQEALSEPWCYTLRFTSPEQDISPENIMLQPAIFVMRSPNPDYSRYRKNLPKWQCLREVHGIITAFSRLSANKDESYYEATLEHPLVLLRHSRRYAIYQQVSVPEVVTRILKSHGLHGYEINMDNLSWRYPLREMMVQWGESDYDFVLRVLSETGIWFRFEPHEKVENVTVIVFSDSLKMYIRGHTIQALPEAGLVGDTLTIRDMVSHAQVTPRAAHSRNYYYHNKEEPFPESTADQGREAPFTVGCDYQYGDNTQSMGDRYAVAPGEVAESAWFYARIRHERHLCARVQLHATADDPAILPGMLVQITGDTPQVFEPGFLVTSLVCQGGRGHGFQAKLSGMPKNNLVVWRPAYRPRPVITGTVPARVSGSKRNDQLARPDKFGRYKVKFSFDRDEWHKGEESMPVRLARIYAGDQYGIHFPLLDNMEVAVAFEGGDPERPYIAHVLHNAFNPDVVNYTNSTRNVIRTHGKNKLRMEDKKGEQHIKLATEPGKSQLNLGRMVDAERKPRGEGAELRTDNHTAIRSAKGILLTTASQPGAKGKQLDMPETIRQLEQALVLARSLQGSAQQAGSDTVDTGSQQEANQALQHLNQPGIVAWGDAGITQATPKNLQLSAGKDAIVTAENHGSINILKTLSLAAGQGISAFVRKAGIKLIAASGNLNFQAQRGTLSALSEQNMQLTSSKGELQLSAKNGIFLHSGGGGIRIHPNGSVEIFSPVSIDQKSPTLAWHPGDTTKLVAPAFNPGALGRKVQLCCDGEPGQVLVNQAFRIKRADGSVVEGKTDANGHSPLLSLTETEACVVSLKREAKQ
ncbi:type VI secretion system Vgr family protein [Mangrovibacter yixingensis]|uniref:type VI secretion system Vgr family protein n=1 Tax=Mangrovibacter yixingensis TaxID=1529639 RepID=UPI001CFB31F5|nr:type VI secretion system Vgr family protein [Mangrovibacter yixingensis]